MSYGESDAAWEDYSTEAAAPSEREMRRAKLRAEDGRAPVERALERCNEQAARVLEMAENLHHRLGPILGPDRPEPAMGEVRNGDDYSPLASQLEVLVDRLADAVATLGRTTRRVEL